MAEENLDNFWQETDKMLQAKIRISCLEILKNCTNGHRTLQRTSSWIDPPKRARRGSERPVRESLPQAFQSLDILSHDPASQVTGAFQRMNIVMKEK
jgi:hypothetical protein